jgi:hypothetical protein
MQREGRAITAQPKGSGGFGACPAAAKLEEVSMPVKKRRSSATKSKPKLKTSMKKKAGKKKKK